MRRFIFLLILSLLCLSQAIAQSPNGTINGIVLDSSGAAIPGAEIVVINDGTGVQYTTRANGMGIYVVSNLPPGPYRIQVSKSGFKTIIKPDIVIHVQDALAINFTLPIGSASEIVTVQGGGLVMNTTDASVGTVVDRRFVENVPLNGRSFQDLISMTPGVVTQNPNNGGAAGTQGDFSVNGQRTESNYYTVDGVSANVVAGSGFGSLNALASASGSVPAGTILGTTQSLVSVDALQEFRVQSSTYSAEYGRAPGGQFSFVTRSGTNDFHGSLFDYLRNNFFDANDWFNDSLRQPASALRQNDFGGTLGGPILIPGLYRGRDKTFFFASYEGLRLTQPQAASTNQLVPDAFMRLQAPAALQPILNAFPVQNGQDFGTAAAPSLAQFIHSFSVPSRIDSTSVRIDHTLGPTLSLFFRFGYTPSSQAVRSLSVLSQNTSDTETYTLGAVSQLADRASNDFRLGYARSDTRRKPMLDSFGGAAPINLGTALGADASASVNTDLIIPGVGSTVLSEFNTRNRLRQWNLVDTFTIVWGHHQFKFGGDYRRIVSPANPASPFVIPVYTSAQQILNNQALELVVLNQLSATPIFQETSAFFQDEWRVTARLNLSLGLRWDVDPPPHGADGNDPFTLLGSLSNPASLTVAPRGTPLWNTSLYNFAPRVGLAWAAHKKPGWETVVRAGGGVFFDTNNRVATSGFTGIGFSAEGVSLGAPLPVTAAELNLTPSASPPFTSANVYAFPVHLQLPYTLEWNVAVQQALGKKQAITITYVGSAGRRLQGEQFLHFGKFNPNFGTIVFYKTSLTSDYDALQAQFQRTVSTGVHALASYTWSHCIDFGSSDASLPFTRGNCDFDVRHNFQGGASWDLPSVAGGKVAQVLANHWGIDARLIARTGFPVFLCGNQIIDTATGSQFCAGLDRVANQPTYLYGSQYPGGRAINPAAFAFPSGTNQGDLPRNSVLGFGEWQINMAVRREFPIREALRLQFRAEAFNVLNHPNFGFIDPSLSSNTFGRALFMLNQNLGTVASQYQQGGPRSMQFALKLLF